MTTSAPPPISLRSNSTLAMPSRVIGLSSTNARTSRLPRHHSMIPASRKLCQSRTDTVRVVYLRGQRQVYVRPRRFWQLSLTFVNKNPVVPGHVLMRKVARLRDLRRRLFKEMDEPGILQRYISKSGFCVLKTDVCVVICKLHMTRFITEAHNFYFIF